MNFDIAVRLTPQRSTIICHDMKHIIKNKKKIYKTMGDKAKPMARKNDNYSPTKLNKNERGS